MSATRAVRNVFQFIVAVCFCALAGGPALAGQAVPGFSKAFNPDTIGPGSVSMLVFTIDNSNGVAPATDLAFTDTLPGGVTLAAPALVSNTCSGTVTAAGGGGTISLVDGAVGAGRTCQVVVNVTAGAIDGVDTTYMNTSGDLTSSAGNSGPATDDLTVDVDRPGFSKVFSPSSVPVGTRSTLTFTIDNTANDVAATSLDFTDNLPTGMVIAEPANASTDCGDPLIPATLTATPGSSVVDLFANGTAGFPALGAGATCTVVLDVVPTGIGALGNVSGELIAQVGAASLSSGKAAAVLTVTRDPLTLVKEFTNDAVPPGATVNLQFRITNFDRDSVATGIAFSDDLSAALVGLAATDTPLTDPCGAGSTLSGTTNLTLTGGNLGPGESCQFDVTLQVPAGAAQGIYTNTTGAITGDIGGLGVTGSPGSDDLFVEAAPILTKQFTDDPVGPGGTVTLEFTITNTADSAATDIGFTDTFNEVIVSDSMLPADGFCGMGSTATFTDLNPAASPPNAVLTISGASLAPTGMMDDSCTFSVALNVAPGAPTGTYRNTTSVITATVGETTVTGNPATDDLVVLAAPSLRKEFIDDPALEGGTATLRFTLTHSVDAPTSATGINFTDDLNATLSGLTAIGLPMNDVCGPGSSISGAGNLSFTGGSLAPGESCNFAVTLQIPDPAAAGAHTNTTSLVNANVSGVDVSSPAAGDDLIIASLVLTKSFTNDPVLPGTTVNLEFNIENVGSQAASNILFFDNLNDTLSGLAATGLPQMDVCGTGSSLSGTSTIFLAGGSLDPGQSCTFSVTLQVPSNAANDTYLNSTTGFQATINDSTIQLPNASDGLVVSNSVLSLTKSFTNDPVAPGGTVNLQFTLTNQDANIGAFDIGFSDNLGAALAGLAATGLPQMDVCGAGSSLTGTSTIVLAGASLAAGGSCTFNVTVSVPSSVPFGTPVVNTTSQVTGANSNERAITGDPASDTLLIRSVRLTKAFDGPTAAGATPTLTFTIENLDAVSGVGGLSFSDNLNAALTGLAAIGLPANDVCGTGSTVSGTSTVSLTGGSLGPGGTCSFNVILQVPANATPGDYLNTTGAVFSSGLRVAEPASDTLNVEGPPLFGKSFSPTSVVLGFNSRLTFSIDNGPNEATAANLAFTDILPADLVVATPPNSSNGCGGTLTATAGSGVISLSGGSVAGGAACMVQVDVTAIAPGAHVNTSGELTSSLGSSGTAQASLTATPLSPTVSKSFIDDPLRPGDLGTLRFTVVNPNVIGTATGIAFSDNLNATLPGLIASDVGGGVDDRGDPLPVDDPCGAGSQLTGGSTVALTGGTLAPGASCTFSVRILVPSAAAAGAYPNTTSPVTATVAGAPTEGPGAQDTLQIEAPPAGGLEIVKSAVTPQVVMGNPATFSIALRNVGASTLTGVSVDDPLSPACNRSVGTLAPSASFTYQCQSPALTADFTNEATATATPAEGEPFSVSDTAFVEVVPPSITIEKTAVTPQVDEGQPGTFMITINNLTEGTLTGLAVDDPFAPDCARDPGELGDLAGMASTSYTCVTEDLFATFTNTATVTADGGLSATDSATIEVINLIEFVKEPVEQQIDAGSRAEFMITVRNPASEARTDLNITDPLTPECARVIPSLAAGAETTYTCGLDSVFGSFTNVATLTVQIGEQTVTRVASANVTVRNPEIEIFKVAVAGLVQAGERATFTITINNVGPSVKTNLVVTDPLTPDCERSPADLGDLPIGGSISYTCQTEPLFASFINVVTVTATIVGGEPGAASAVAAVPQGPGATATAMASAQVTVIAPQIEIVKSPASPQVVPGDSAQFTITIRNVGMQDLSNISVSDPATPACDATLTGVVLTPGDATSYMCSTGPLSADLVNTATVTAQLPTGDPISASDTATVQVGFVPVGLENIPTLSEWGIMALFCLLAGAGLWMIKRREGAV